MGHNYSVVYSQLAKRGNFLFSIHFIDKVKTTTNLWRINEVNFIDIYEKSEILLGGSPFFFYH